MKKKNNVNVETKEKLTSKNETLAIVVTYNRKTLLLECIEALKNLKETKCDILIVNNASTDDTEETIKPMVNDGLLYVNTGKNLGGAGGFNYGIRYAIENYNYKYLWLMDDDTIVTDTALLELYKAKDLLNDDFGFLSSKVLWIDGNYCLMNKQKLDLYNWDESHKYIKNGLIRINGGTFVSCFFKTDIAKEVGLPIKEFFIWNDDMEYTERISDIYKYPSYYVDNSIAIHKMNSNTKKAFLYEEDKKRIDRVFYSYRNEFYTRRRKGFVGVVKHTSKAFLYMIKCLFLSKKYRFRRVWTILKGYCAGLFFFPKIEYVGENKKRKR